jgi:hypothetical protein
MSDIVERLRQKDYTFCPINPDGYEAAAEIERLREINRIAIRDNAKLVVERDRLRDALRKAAKVAGYVLCRRGDPNDPRRRVMLDDDYDIAALKGDTP